MRPVFFLSACVGLALAVPSRRSGHVLHERRAAEPIEWFQHRRLESHKVLPMRFGLSQSNLHRLEEILMSVSHPDSPSYGKHLSPEEVVETFAPSGDTITAVTDWLVGAGFTPDRVRLTPNRGWIEVNATVAEVEDLLNTEYHVYTHPSGAEQYGCHSYSVPEYIQPHIDLIKPTVHFNHRVAPRSILQKRSAHLGTPGPKTNGVKVLATPTLATCDQAITPDCLRALYNINRTPVSTSKNTFGILEFGNQAFLAPDLDLFFKNFTPSLVGVRPNIVLIDGAVVQTTTQGFATNGESDLDLQYAMALTDPQPITLLQTGDLVEGASFNNWLDAVDGVYCTFEGGDDPNLDGIYPDPLAGGFKGPESCGVLAPPKTISVSYGQDESTVTAAYANRQCNEYAKLGMMGSTVVYSTGDFGVAGFNNVCLTASGTPSKRGPKFNPDFPATCPFITAVGATQINPGSPVTAPESACEQVIFSGGGFSNIFPMPSYQAAAVSSFLTNHPPPYTATQFNNSGKVRGFPDISANGANYVVAVDGSFQLVFGTSAAAPVFASIITLVNDARIAAGKSTVGFINPSLYAPSFASGINDITSGGNQGCGTPGFTSTTGWDPVTGVGTPNFGNLVNLFLAAP